MALLRVLKGGTPGQVLPLDKPTVVLGREAKDCDYVIPNQAVSRVHAQISLVDGRHYIEDLKSRNKTYVNNKIIESPTALNDNDRKRANEIMAYPWFKENKAWQKEINKMMSNGFKMEVESLITKDISYVTEEYVPERLKKKDWLD